MNAKLISCFVACVVVCACGKGKQSVDAPHPISGMNRLNDAQSVKIRQGVNLAWGSDPSDGSVEVVMVIDGSQVLQINVFGNGHQALLSAANAGTLVTNVNKAADGTTTLDMVRMINKQDGKTEIRTYDQKGDLLSVSEK